MEKVYCVIRYTVYHVMDESLFYSTKMMLITHVHVTH